MKQFATNEDGQPVVYLVQYGEFGQGVHMSEICAAFNTAMGVAKGWMERPILEGNWRAEALEPGGAICAAWVHKCDYIEIIEQVVK